MWKLIFNISENAEVHFNYMLIFTCLKSLLLVY